MDSTGSKPQTQATAEQPEASSDILATLAEIGEEVIVILSTHIVEDVRELCRRMAIINAGEVILQGDPGCLDQALH